MHTSKAEIWLCMRTMTLSCPSVTCLHNCMTLNAWWSRSTSCSRIIPRVKALHHSWNSCNSSINLPPDFRANIWHRHIMWKKPLCPATCTICYRISVSGMTCRKITTRMIKTKKKMLIKANFNRHEWNYLNETALRRDFNDSEKDWKSDGPALFWLFWEDWLAKLLLYNQHKREYYNPKYSIKTHKKKIQHILISRCTGY